MRSWIEPINEVLRAEGIDPRKVTEVTVTWHPTLGAKMAATLVLSEESQRILNFAQDNGKKDNGS